MNYITAVRPNSRKEEVLNVLRHNPNSTTKELSALLPHLDIDHISHAVSSMAEKGIVFITGKKSEMGPSGRTCTHRAYSAKHEKMNKNTPAKEESQPDLFGQLIETLKAEIDVLEKWKAAVLLRYPDLEVSPLVLEARDLLAAQLEEDGEHLRADEVRNGGMDDTSSLRALVKALGDSK
jgi:hypothetical protein